MQSRTRQSQVHLVPWDPESSQHIDRLFEQRVQCGWHNDLVATQWPDEQRSGKKCIYWITLSPEDAGSEHTLQLHFHSFPKEKDPLTDTAHSVGGSPRKATQAAIFPVGHISLDTGNAVAGHLNLDLPTRGVYWIKTFYVSKALQSKGIGRAAMDTVESMAVNEPLYAKTLALDTIHKEDSRRQVLEATGQLPKMTNHEWYERRGYRAIHSEQDFYDLHLKTVFMRRDIA
ncbi:hypothetical protein FZEAL_7653 [Fusarium zealandicum]|uniref:N-acetyltransferase domain-containing protein n=1 Tax=Fusarium zealandicum TaxID=1053134 RepID=A0A8H4UGB6_9HYPO|nr:hypothetical protein FZEAL_7653 [Fusarium zealandicum]